MASGAATPSVLSLLPSATEIVCAVGGQDALVGISHECDFPPLVSRLPVVTRARIADGMSSRDIDAAVRRVLEGALSVYSVDQGLLQALAPDVIVTQDLCEVCAVSLDDVRAAVARLAHRDQVDILSLTPTRLADVLADIDRVGVAIGRGEEAANVRRALEVRISRVAERASAAAERPRVVSLEWLEPLMLGGTWMPELIELAGGTPVGATAGAPAPTLTGEQLESLRPDIVLIKPCGFPIDRTFSERGILDRLEARLPNAELFVTDGNAYFNRPGPRLVESLEILAACIHPPRFEDFGGKHAGVIRRL